jgi:signal transduction histidine kinase/DNA-binding response OmpR family regulator
MLTDTPINILMVDDSATNLMALETILAAPGRRLIRADSGEEALRYLLDNDAAVVLLDVYMPGIDGLETAELIRRREKLCDVPIIFLTANSTGIRHLSRGYSLGAVDYIVKPVDPEILRSKVAVFVELFKKNREIEYQAELLREKNRELENANLARLKMLIDLGQELTAEHDPTQVLVKFCRSARKIVNAEEAAVGGLDSDGQTLHYFFHCGEHKETVLPTVIPELVQRGLDRMITDRRTLRLSEADDLFVDDTPANDALRSFLGAPILTAAGVSGWVYLVNKIDADEFNEADERLAGTLATQLGVAYENARLYTEAQTHAAELRAEIGERKQAEQERAQMLIREQEARAEAEQANRTKDEFLATLSHELRTPLTAILGWSHLLRGQELTGAEFGHAVETIERSARAQSQLIDDLLDVSRIVTGKFEIEFAALDFSNLIHATVESVKPSFAAKEIRLETSVEPGCLVHGDDRRLQQILWNLLNNALKFTPKGGIVTVSGLRHPDKTQLVVADTGKGIGETFLPYIFHRFRQADGSTTRQYGGLGLGLAIVRHVVELHGGTIDVISPGADRGTTFTVTLPLFSVAAPRNGGAGVDRPSEMPSNGEPPLLNGSKILMVDDDSDARQLVAAILTRCGCEVRCFETTAEALAAFCNWDPDLVVSDIGMPQDDGYSLIRKLRQLQTERAQNVPALALTAYATEEDRSRALSAGFQMHLAKPINPGSLVNTIATALGREPAGD